jgi:plastocyanin
MNAKSTLIALVVLALPLATACTGSAAPAAPKAASPAATTAAAPAGSPAAKPAGSPAAAGAQQVTVKGLDTLKFDPESINVRAGQPVQVTFQNDGAIIHDFTIEASQGVSSQVQVIAQGKGSGTTTFTIAQPGTYRFICAQPGHAAGGMTGTIVAQ